MVKVVIEVFPFLSFFFLFFFFFYGKKYFLYHIIIYVNSISIKMMLSIWVMYFIDQNHLRIISFFEKKKLQMIFLTVYMIMNMRQMDCMEYCAKILLTGNKWLDGIFSNYSQYLLWKVHKQCNESMNNVLEKYLKPNQNLLHNLF